MQVECRGHQCDVEVYGDASAPVLTLLHSVGLSTREGWRFQIPALTSHFRVISYDFRGLGQSSAGSEPLGVATFVADLEALLEHLGVTSTALMGVSLGGFVAQAFTLKRPDLVRAMVLVSTAPYIFRGHEQRRAERNAQIRQHGMAVAARHQLSSHFPEAYSADNPDVLDWYRRHYEANDPENYIAIMEDLSHFDTRDRLGAIACPTLIVAGGADATSVAGKEPLDSARTLHRLIHGSELLVIDGALHYPHIDHRDAFNAGVIPFLKSHAQTVAPA